MNSEYEIFYSLPSISPNFEDLIKEYNQDNLSKISLIFSNLLFKLYSANFSDVNHTNKKAKKHYKLLEKANAVNISLTKSNISSCELKESIEAIQENCEELAICKEDLEKLPGKIEKQKVILLEFTILKNDEFSISQLKSSILRSENIIHSNVDFHYFYLKRIGFCRNEENNSVYLIYSENGNKIIDLVKIYNENENPKMLLLMYFQLFVDFYMNHYDQKSHFFILHPQMIFLSKICGFQLVDFIFAELFKLLRFDINSFSLANLFGIFDLELIEKEKFDLDKQIIRNASDIILLSIFLAYLFSFDKTNKNSNENSVKNNYSNLVFKLRNDFNSKNSSFSHFLEYVNDKQVSFFLSKILNLNYREIASIYKFKELFNSILIENNLQSIKCYSMDCNSASAERMNFICNHFLCRECYKKHVKCENVIPNSICYNKDNHQITNEKFRLSNVLKELTFDITFQNFIKNSEKVKDNFCKIEIEQEKMGRYATMIDDKLNNMKYFVEDLVCDSEKSKRDCLKRLTQGVENEILTIRILQDKKMKLKKETELTIFSKNPNRPKNREQVD